MINNIIMDELLLIKLTQYAYAILGKNLPKSCVLKAPFDALGNKEVNVVKFHKYEGGRLWQITSSAVGFYFEHKFVLRSKNDGKELFSLHGDKLDEAISCL